MEALHLEGTTPSSLALQAQVAVSLGWALPFKVFEPVRHGALWHFQLVPTAVWKAMDAGLRIDMLKQATAAAALGFDVVAAE